MGDVSTWGLMQILTACAASGLVMLIAFLVAMGIWVGLDILRGVLEGRARRCDGPCR